MSDFYIITIFDNKKPRTIGIRYEGRDKYFDMFRTGGYKSIREINDKLDIIFSIIVKCIDTGSRIILNDFKSYCQMYHNMHNIPIESIYDVHAYDFDTDGTYQSDKVAIKAVLDEFTDNILPYQNIIARAAKVYKAFEDNGVLSHYTKMSTKWSLDTYTGRSKCSGFNVQGAVELDNIRSVSSSYDDRIVTLDWISADFRMASLLADDKVLESSFFESDPYTYLMNILNADNENNTKLTRSETKLYMLKSINGSLSDSPVFDVYKNLGKWVNRTWSSINSGNDVYSILGRRFKASNAKNSKSLINAIMQGSTAHAMQAVLPRLYDYFGDKLITEIHDSIPIMVKLTKSDVTATINAATDIMMQPFLGILDGNPIFPVKVSIGKWKKWQEYKIYRELR